MLSFLLSSLGFPAESLQYVLFNKSPFDLEQYRFDQRDPPSFTCAAFTQFQQITAVTPTPELAAGLHFQFQLFSRGGPDTAIASINNFFQCAENTNIPVAVTLDPSQWWDERPDLWNWWDATRPGFDPANTVNVEWTAFNPKNATQIAWRNWGSQFRVPEPQPNYGSGPFLAASVATLQRVVPAVQFWYKRWAQAGKLSLFAGLKICEEADIGGNFFYYPHGNQIFQQYPNTTVHDPTYGLNFSIDLAGGLQPMGYNAVRSLGRSQGGVPTRAELGAVLHAYLENVTHEVALLFPDVQLDGRLYTHVGDVGNPLANHMAWEVAQTSAALPGYSMYWGDPRGLEGLATALNGEHWVAGEWWCFTCSTQQEWQDALLQVMSFAQTDFISVQNWFPFSTNFAALAALQQFFKTYKQ